MSDRQGPRLSESNRVEAFSDGVFAIAITLLVLELAIPATSGEFTKDLRDEWVSYVAYLAAFANIGVLCPSIALLIFLLFPILYVVRARSAEHPREG